MKKYFAALMAIMMLFTMSVGNNVYAESVREIEHIIFVDDEDFNEGSNVTPFAYEWEKEYKDGVFVKAPKGTASKEFKVESGDTRLNVWFDNDSDVSVKLTLFKKSGIFGSWSEVDSVTVPANDDKQIPTINNPDPDVKYKAEVSNTTGDKILGTLRIRSYAY